MVHFVGAGCGAADLITLRGKRLLEEADVVIYAGSLVNPELLSFAKEQGFPDRERQRQWMLRLSGEFKSRAESVFEKAASEKRMVLSVSLAAGALVVVLFW